jgi:hypothetical protein
VAGGAGAYVGNANSSGGSSTNVTTDDLPNSNGNGGANNSGTNKNYDVFS